MQLSQDQAEAHDILTGVLSRAGFDLMNSSFTPAADGPCQVLAILGKAGSGKTMLLAQVVAELLAAGVTMVSADYEGRARKDKRSLAVLAPTNKAASVLRQQGVPATTIHRILYTPLYDPEYEKVAAWLAGDGKRPTVEGLTDAALDRALAFYQLHKSVPGALATAGLRGSDFITGWKRREDPLDIGFLDEASMLDDKQFDDLKEVFSTLIMFGDPAQLAPVSQSGNMCFDALPEARKCYLNRIHRQAADNPILDLAHALGDQALSFEGFEEMVREAAARDDRVVIAPRADAQLMTRSPMLVWRNATRVRLIHAFRAAYGAPSDDLLPGEPLICDGIELPVKHRKKRIDLEARGLIKGAQAVYLGPGTRAGFSRLYIAGAEEPRLNAASIIQIEVLGEDEPFFPSAARMGAVFLHGAACTIHKAQGSQWPQVQVFAPDFYAAYRSGREVAGIALWKRLAYVAITRAETRLFWVTRYAMARPDAPLGIDDLGNDPPVALKLSATEA